MPIERAVTLHRYMDHFCVTTYSPRDGIVLWELQEQKCQQRVCQYSDVVQTGQAGWMVLILRWEMVKLKAAVVQTECEANKLRVVREITNRSVDTCM